METIDPGVSGSNRSVCEPRTIDLQSYATVFSGKKLCEELSFL